MIKIKSAHELKLMQEAGQIAAAARAAAGALVAPGITTRELDNAARKVIESCGAKPSFLHYNGFPASICCSINHQVIHGFPGKYKLKEGDLVKIDVGANYMGYHGDCAETFPVGKITEEAQKLIEVTRQSFYEGIKLAREGQRVSDISHAVQAYVEANGFSVVRDYVGHGVGAVMHEDPEVPNYATPRRGPRLLAGMTLAIEPMITLRGDEVKTLSNGWTVVTESGLPAAHFEHTVAITDNGPVILTPRDFG